MVEILPPDADAYWHARRHAVLFDVSERGKIEVTGKEAAMFLHNLCTNDIKNLAPGSGCEAFFTTAKAKVIAYALIYHRPSPEGQDAFWIDVDPNVADKLMKHLDRHLISEQAEFSDHIAEFGQLHLAGPESSAVLGKASHEATLSLGELQHRTQTIAAVACQTRRHDALGVPGYDLIFARDNTAAVRQALAEAGARSAGMDVLDVLRIEAGTPVYGLDMDDERAVMEVGRTKQAICYTKGCFLGQEPIVMARDRGHVNRTLLGVRFSGEEAVARLAKLLHDGQEVGQVTSSSWSPGLNASIGLAYIRRGFQEPGRRLEVEGAAGRTAEVASLPFSISGA